VLVPLIKNFGNVLIAMVGNIDSFLAKQSDIILNSMVDQKACPNNLAPKTSTTAQLVLGDAIAVCLMELKGFSSDNFAKFHPGGMLGKTIPARIGYLPRHERPLVSPNQSLKEVIMEITKKKVGVPLPSLTITIPFLALLQMETKKNA
jgi:arabinose-5-phosphate isomerase